MKLALAFVGGVVVAACSFIFLTPNQPKPVAPVSAPAVEAPAAEPVMVASAAEPQAESGPKSEPVPRSEPVRAKKPAPRKVHPNPKPVQGDQPLAEAIPAPVVPEASPVPPAEPQKPIEAPQAAEAPNPAPLPEKVELLKPDALERKRAKEERTPQTATIPAGTVLHVRMNQSLSSETNENGDTFSGTLDQPLIVNGMVLAEKGSRVDGRVVDAVRSGRVKGLGKLSVRLTQLHTSDRQRVEILSDDFVRTAEASKRGDLTKIGVGAGIGAALGAIFGGGSGAAIGAATGSAAGAGGVLLSRGKPAQLDVESRIPFRLREAVTITENLQ